MKKAVYAMTRVIIIFHFPPPEIVESTEDIDFQCVFQKISEENFQGLPQGGGIFSKYVFLKQKICPVF